MQSIAEITEKILQTAPNAQYLPKHLLDQWSQRIFAKEYNDFSVAPANLDISKSETSSFSGSNQEKLDNEEEDDYGDIVTVKSVPFVVCSGLVIPQNMLKDKIIPMVNEEMKRLGINVNDVYSALMEIK